MILSLVTIGMFGTITSENSNKFPMSPPKVSLGGNTLAIYLESDELLWAWGRDAEILSRIMKLPLRTAIENKTVWQYVCFRYRGNPDELQEGLGKLLPYNVAILR